MLREVAVVFRLGEVKHRINGLQKIGRHRVAEVVLY
jgi:hypothetical protein